MFLRILQAVVAGALLAVAFHPPAAARKCVPPTYYQDVLELARVGDVTLDGGPAPQEEVARWADEGRLIRSFGDEVTLDVRTDGTQTLLVAE
jgi:hypothetical protein